mgnify:CR=1 FL=1
MKTAVLSQKCERVRIWCITYLPEYFFHAFGLGFLAYLAWYVYAMLREFFLLVF